MKKTLLSLVCFLVIGFGEMKAQWVTIPNANFVTFLQQQYPSCMNGNQMDTTCAAILNEDSLYCSSKGISNFQGLQYFKNLRYFDCQANYQLSSLPPLPETLWALIFNSNYLTSLPPLPPGLKHLEGFWNSLTSLPTLPSSLKWMDVQHNELTSLPALPVGMTSLNFNSNHISTVPILPDSLVYLLSSGNPLTSLPPLPVTLFSLRTGNCQLTSLPALPPLLDELECERNQLTSLPYLPESIRYISCEYNRLTSLTNIPPVLYKFTANNNPDLKCLPYFKSYVSHPGSFSIRGTGIKCLPNYIEHYQAILEIDTLPICDLYNANGCDIYWNIKGAVYQDADNDCVMGSGEAKLAPVKMNLYRADTLIQSGYFSKGDYEFDTEMGTYTVAVDTNEFPLTFSCPASGDTTLSLYTYDSIKSGINFGVQCAPGFDLAVGSIVGTRFRPACNEQINIKAGDLASAYGIQCADGISGNVSITITGPAKYISPEVGALTPSNVIGNTLTYNVTDFGTVNSNTDFNIVIRPDTLAQAGEQICFTVSVTPTTGDNNPTNNVLMQCFQVRTSYDPNDKQVYPDGDILSEQDWLTYTIRFQNTGNDTAIHVQVIDTLDSHVDAASFKLLAYSHPNITQILEGGIVKFNFPNIMLPDSNVNEPLSHGYIQYKVKLKENLPIGTHIANTAYIYFDFNAPVVTNTTTNTITTATAVSPLSFREGSGVRLYPNPTTSQLFIQTTGPQLRAVAIFDINGRKLMEQDFASPVDVSALSSGVYLLEVKSKDGVVRKRWVKE